MEMFTDTIDSLSDIVRDCNYHAQNREWWKIEQMITEQQAKKMSSAQLVTFARCLSPYRKFVDNYDSFLQNAARLIDGMNKDSARILKGLL